MELALSQFRLPEMQTLWRVAAAGRQRIAAGRPYWFDNRDRQPRGSCVVQLGLEGSIRFRDAGGDHHVEPGRVLLFTYGEGSGYGHRPEDGMAAGHDYRCQWVNLGGAGLVEHLDALRQRHGSILDVGPVEAVSHELDELAQLAAPDSPHSLTEAAALVHAFVMRLFERAARNLFQTQTPVERAVEQILRQPARPWSLKEVARRHGISREHLTRVFVQRVGQSPGTYLTQARLRLALRLLEDSALPIAGVARQAGYTSPHHLARCVRRVTGLSPQQYRDQR